MRRILPVLVMAAAVCAQRNEPTPSYQPNWPCTGQERAFDPAYLRTAEASGGQIFLFDRSEMGGFSALARNDTAHGATLARSVGTLANYLEVRVAVDPSVESLYIAASLQCTQRIAIYDPQNAEARPELAGGEDHLYRAGRISVIPRPAPGVWTVRLLGKGAYSLAVQGRTPFTLGGVSFAGAGPRAGIEQQVNVYVNAPTPSLRFRLVNQAGQDPQPIMFEPSPAGSGRYAARVTPGAQPFRLLVEGTDEEGNVFFQRMDPRLFEPKAIQ